MSATKVLRDIAGAALWIVVALVVAIGAAGILSGVGGPPGGPARPELTHAGDRELRAGLADVSGRIADLSTEIETLVDQGRIALAALAARDVDRAQVAIDEGSVIAAAVVEHAAGLRGATTALPGGGASASLSFAPELVAAREIVRGAPAATDQLEDTWLQFSVAAITAQRLADLLTRHDEETGAAATLGRAGRYREAADALDKSDATLDEIERLHDQLQSAADTTVLATWIERNRAYDAALRTLYRAFVDSKGRVTKAVRAAIDAEAEARALLPPDTRSLSVVMSEVAQGGLNQAVVAIDQARLRLEDVLAALDAEPGQ
jgi:hypothetical protein